MAIVRGTKLAHKLTMNEVLHEVPYITLMMMNSVVPKYGAGGGSGSGQSQGKNMFEIFDQVSKGKGC